MILVVNKCTCSKVRRPCVRVGWQRTWVWVGRVCGQGQQKLREQGEFVNFKPRDIFVVGRVNLQTQIASQHNSVPSGVMPHTPSSCSIPGKENLECGMDNECDYATEPSIQSLDLFNYSARMYQSCSDDVLPLGIPCKNG